MAMMTTVKAPPPAMHGTEWWRRGPTGDNGRKRTSSLYLTYVTDGVGHRYPLLLFISMKSV
jgi:hypothetical protein